MSSAVASSSARGAVGAMGVSHSGLRKPAERAAFVADHVLYGLVLREPARASQP